MEFSSMPGVSDCAGFMVGSHFSSPMMLPSASPNSVGTPNEIDFAAQYPACLCPCQHFTCSLNDGPRMTRGQDGLLLLSCRTLSFPIPRRFIPAHSVFIGGHLFFSHVRTAGAPIRAPSVSERVR